MRMDPGVASVEGTALQFELKDGSASYTWELVDAVTTPEEEQGFLDFAAANDRIIGHLLKGARFYE